jgi:hypothetical protein
MPGILEENTFCACFFICCSQILSSTTKIISEFEPVESGRIFLLSVQEHKKTKKIISFFSFINYILGIISFDPGFKLFDFNLLSFLILETLTPAYILAISQSVSPFWTV